MFKRTIPLLVLALCPVFANGQLADYHATYTADGKIDHDKYRSYASIESFQHNSSVIYATGGVDLVLTRVFINKTGGVVDDSTRRLTGVNSALLANEGSRVRMYNCEINTHTEMADGLSAVGEGTRVEIENGVFRSSRMGSAAMNANDGASITISAALVESFANQSPSFFASPGGVINVSKCKGENAGQASPVFHSKGSITAEECHMSAGRWTMGNVEGGTLTLSKCDLTSEGVCGFLVYGSKQRTEGGMLNLSKNKLTVKEGPLFIVTNTSAEITMTRNSISGVSDQLMSVAAEDWGRKGSNGANAVLTVNKQSLKGYITVDSISSLRLEMNKGARLNGDINKSENRCAKVDVVINAGSSWKSKGDSHVSSIVFEKPVEKGVKQLKGKHTIYYDASNPLNAPLQGKVYKTGGGELRPL